MSEFISNQPDIFFIVSSAAAILISLVIFMAIKHKLFAAKSPGQDAVIAILFTSVCAIGQFVLIRLVFYPDGVYTDRGPAGVIIWAVICLLPFLIAVLPALTLLFISKRRS